jgi:hypothetical protein
LFHCSYFIKQLPNGFPSRIAWSMHLGCCSTFGKRKNTLVCGSSIFTLSESLANGSCMDHAILHGKPFGIPLTLYDLFTDRIVCYHFAKIWTNYMWKRSVLSVYLIMQKVYALHLTISHTDKKLFLKHTKHPRELYLSKHTFNQALLFLIVTCLNRPLTYICTQGLFLGFMYVISLLRRPLYGF